jgi:hypothetical protein
VKNEVSSNAREKILEATRIARAQGYGGLNIRDLAADVLRPETRCCVAPGFVASPYTAYNVEDGCRLLIGEELSERAETCISSRSQRESCIGRMSELRLHRLFFAPNDSIIASLSSKM